MLTEGRGDWEYLQKLLLIPGITKFPVDNPRRRSKGMRLSFARINDVNDCNTMCL